MNIDICVDCSKVLTKEDILYVRSFFYWSTVKSVGRTMMTQLLTARTAGHRCNREQALPGARDETNASVVPGERDRMSASVSLRVELSLG